MNQPRFSNCELTFSTGSPEAAESIAQTVINTAVHEQGTLAFNYASLALNNDYFLNQLVRIVYPSHGLI